MASTSTCSSIDQPSGSGLCRPRKRSHSTEDESDTPIKISRNHPLHTLIDFPERNTDPGSETEFSFQEDETDLCCRSSETSGSESSERNEVEFEIRSPKEGPNPFGDSSTDSEAVSVTMLQEVIGLPPPKTWDNSGNSSCASSGSSDVFDPEIPRRDYWTCLQCHSINNRPAFRYCEKCFKVRRDMFQQRVKPRKRRKRKSSRRAAAARNPTASEANSGRTAGSDRPSGDGAAAPQAAFHGVKLDSCSQELRDSGVASSQSSALGSSQTTASCGKESDGSLSPDSGADAPGPVKLSSTRGRAPDVLETAALEPRCGVDVVDSLARITRREVGAVFCQTDTLNRDSSPIDLTPRTSRGVEEAVSSQLSSIRAVDSLWPFPNRDSVDEVDSFPPKSQGTDEVDGPPTLSTPGLVRGHTFWPPSSRGVDEVDTVRPPTSGGVDEVDCVDGDDSAQNRLPRHSGSGDGAALSSSLPSSVSLCVDDVSTSKRSVRTQTYLSFSRKSSIPKEDAINNIDKCMMCFDRSLDGIFVHAMYAHQACCYKCTVRVWKTTKRCPLCNCKVMNVLRLFRG